MQVSRDAVALYFRPEVLDFPSMFRSVKTNSIRRVCFGVLSLSLVVLWLLFLGVPAASADTATLISTADSDIRQRTPDNNYGSDDYMDSGGLGTTALGEIRRSLLSFDLTPVPPGSIINSVTVNVSVIKEPLTPTDSFFDLRRVLQNWDESQVTWNSRLSGVPWQVAGAAGSADASSNASSSVFVVDNGTYTFPSTSALVADVQAWLDNPSTNFGWLLVSEEEDTYFTARHFGTREGFFAYAPTLVIDFTPSGPVIQTQPQNQAVVIGGTGAFTVVASGAPPLSYQWQFNGNPIPNGTNATLLLSNVQTNQAGDYLVIVTDGNGTATASQSATLTVMPSAPELPSVTITNPLPGSSFPLGSTVFVAVDASESNGAIAQVEFFLGTNSLAVLTGPPFSLTLSNLAAGDYSLSATATDTAGSNATSPAVTFSMVAPPLVSLTQPANGSAFAPGTSISLSANAHSAGSTVTNVAFFANSALIGQSGGPSFHSTFQPTQAGSYSLSAVAFDALGQSATSAPVAILVFTPENIAPTLKLTNSPPNFSRLTNGLVFLAGTAADDVAVARVEFQVNGGPFQAASGTNRWSAQVQLTPGTNTVVVRSVDLAGNTSRPATRFFTYVVFASLTVQQLGDGTVTPNLNAKQLEIGQVLTLTARPAPGQIFAGWGGISNSQGAVLKFSMLPDLVLVANFVPNPFPPVAGAYKGLFFDINTNNIVAETSGEILLQLGNKGAFSGKLVRNVGAFPFHGQFNPLGDTSLPVRSSFSPVVLALHLDLTGGSGQLVGFVTNGVGTNLVVGQLLATRNAFSAQNPRPQKGQYPFLLQTTSSNLFGSGTVQVTTAGAVNFQGSLNYGLFFSVDSPLGSDGTSAFYIRFNRGTEILFGWAVFTNQPPSLTGSFFWSQSAPAALVTPLELFEPGLGK